MLRCNKNQDYLMFKCSLTDSITYLAIDHFHSAYKPSINPNIK
jgi:inhibitor of KinA sporulation pathway (predicted exonuclease)